MNLGIDLGFAPMEAQTAKDLPTDSNYQFEPKWDGFRALCFKDGNEVAFQSKSGQPLSRYFPELVEAVKAIPAERFVLDGEIVLAVEDRLDFDQLLERIHPAASRITMLSRKYPAKYLAFDILVDETKNPLHRSPLTQRRPALEAFAAKYLIAQTGLSLSPATMDPRVVARWYACVGGALDGIIAKRTDIAYSSGNRRGMLKIKRLRTADCVVGGFRFSTDRSAIASLLLGLYNDAGALDYVGFTSGFRSAEKIALLERVNGIVADASFTGRTPGGPSRWNRGKDSAWVPVEPRLVLEVEFDHVSGGRFRHGTRPLRFRPDKAPRQCTTEQLDQPEGMSPFSLAAAD